MRAGPRRQALRWACRLLLGSQVADLQAQAMWWAGRFFLLAVRLFMADSAYTGYFG